MWKCDETEGDVDTGWVGERQPSEVEAVLSGYRRKAIGGQVRGRTGKRTEQVRVIDLGLRMGKCLRLVTVNG
jgi:hypothetical protein